MASENQNYIVKFSNIGTVKGYKNGCIFDFFRKKIYTVPNELINILNTKKITLQEFKDCFGDEFVFENYYNFLQKNEIIFITESPERFPDISLNYERPHLADLLYLEIDSFQDFKFNFLKTSIENIGITHLILIARDLKNNSIYENVSKITNSLKNSKVQHISLFISHNDSLENNIFDVYSNLDDRIRNIVVYNYKDELESTNENVIFEKTDLKSLFKRKINSIADFDIDFHSFIEANNRNLFYNRKLYIDNHGNITYNIDCDEKFVNIENYDLDELKKTSYFNLWHITKDQIKECKDCKYRYVCPDTRIPILKNDEYYHIDECNYSPYEDKWK
jgi:SPASM domain peptide maturase of grasp-with-spasm system